MEDQALNTYLPRFPPSVILALVLIGVFLLFLRPYYAFLYSVALPLSLSIPTMVFSRVPGWGVVGNLYDLMLLIALAALLLDSLWRRRVPRVPWLSILILLTILMGFVHTTIILGPQYETFRAVRWAISLPVYLFLGFNIVDTPARAKQLLVLAFSCALISETQHMYYVMSGIGSLSSSHLRTVMFMYAHSETWLILLPLLFLVARPPKKLFPIAIASSVLFLSALISHQTRSIALASAAASVALYFWFDSRLAFQKKFAAALILASLLVFVVAVLLPVFGLDSLYDAFADRFSTVGPNKSAAEASLSRKLALDTELQDFLSGNIFIGNGLYYFSKYLHAGLEHGTIAFGHIGYVTYLSQLGIIGFLVYAVIFPAVSLVRARAVWNNSLVPSWFRLVAILSGTLTLYSVFEFFMSNSFLTSDVLPGLTAGVVAATVRQLFPVATVPPSISPSPGPLSTLKTSRGTSFHSPQPQQQAGSSISSGS